MKFILYLQAIVFVIYTLGDFKKENEDNILERYVLIYRG